MKHALLVIGHFISVVIILKIVSLVVPGVILSYYEFICNALFSCVVAVTTFSFVKRRLLNEKVRPADKAVFITGCDSGFGHLLSKRLDSLGYHVFAGCLFPSGQGAEDLKKKSSKNLRVVELDVTKNDSVVKAAQMVKENLGSDRKLWAIVNNAGIQKGFSVEFTPVEFFEETLNVNTFGHVRVSKAFLPMLRKSKGRIVNITSVAGRITHPHMTPYCMSKFAAQSLNDCLRMELLEFGVQVISIEPSAFESSITNPYRIRKAFDAMLESVDPEVLADYKGGYIELSKRLQDLFIKMTSPKIHMVIDDLEAAITSVYPNLSYQTRGNFFLTVAMKIPEFIPVCTEPLLYRMSEHMAWLLKTLSPSTEYDDKPKAS